MYRKTSKAWRQATESNWDSISIPETNVKADCITDEALKSFIKEVLPAEFNSYYEHLINLAVLAGVNRDTVTELFEEEVAPELAAILINLGTQANSKLTEVVE